MKRIVFHPEARKELRDAVAYYETQRTGLGSALRSAIEMATQMIQQVPGIGSLYLGTPIRKFLARRFPYTIYYREFDDRIWIAAVAHQKRRAGYWLDRLPK